MSETLLLFNTEAEMMVLGSMMFGPKNIDQIIPGISAPMFHSEHHRTIFQTMKSMRDSNTNIDPMTLEEHLVRKGILDDVGGRAYILRLLEKVPSPANGRFYAEIVRDYWTLREIERIGGTLVQHCREPEHAENIGAMIGKAQTDLSRVLAGTTRSGFRLSEINASEERESFQSSFELLNKYAEYEGAIIRAQVHLYGAREGVGKSVALVQESVCLLDQGKAGCYYTLTDLKETDIKRRMLRMRTGFSKRPWHLEHAAEFDEYQKSLDDPFLEFQIFTGRAHGYTIEHVCDQIRAYNAQSKLDFAAVDYLQALQPTERQKRMNPFERIAENARTLEWLGDELNIAMLVATQVTENEQNGLMAKGGRDIMEACNNAMFLVRDKTDEDMLKIHVSKMRFGRSGWQFYGWFNKRNMRIETREEC